MRRWFVGVLVLAAAGCAKDVNVAYPSPSGGGAAGVVLVRFTDAMRSVSVRVDGVLVAEDEFTERVEVSGVPAGDREVTVVASAGSRVASIDHTERVQVRADQPAVMLVASPPRSLGYWIQSAAMGIAYATVLILSDWR